ncbi:MAG: hypothetical protein R2568_03715 [Candidatus Scalindua sp.]|jgi:hypothetical protein|nr:hypothetical protein [Candidatus Scalindua sp.]
MNISNGHNQILAFISKIHDEMTKHIDPALLIPLEELELAPLTGKVTNQETASLHHVSKIAAAAAPNKIFIKQSRSEYNDIRPDLLIQLYSILIEAKHKIPVRIITNSIPHIIVLSEDQNEKKIEIMLWQQLFEKGDIFLGRRACLNHKEIPPINVDNCNLKGTWRRKKNIDLGSYWAGYVASYATANSKDILEVYCSILSTLLSDKTINFPVL